PGRLLHVYGPTESTTFTTWQRVREVPAGARTVPIGSPIANTEVYVLDRSLEPVPVGVAGELLAGGDGLARGYAGRAQLSAEKFVPHPFAARPGERLYRTGDLVRTLPEGSIEFLGRIDHQVKLRGFRVELGEIEAVLSSHGGVRESVVLVRDEIAQGGGPARLVAYVVADREPRPAVRELRQFLNKDLPDYMVPSAFVFLDALPLLPNGKVNRRALPAPAPSEVSPEGEFVAPGNPTEELLAGIWEEVLGVTRVGVHDNFFELGGHSLMATQVASRVRETFAVEVPLDKLFEAPTLSELAAIVDAAQLGKRGLEAPPMVAVARDRKFRDGVPLSFAQQRLWFFHQWEPGSSAYNIPATVRLSGAVAAAIIERIFNEVVRRHEALRTTFTTSGERPVQVIAERLRLPLPVADLERLPEPRRRAEARRLADEEAQRLFDLTVGPLVRVTLLRLAEEDHVLLVTMHHIVSDGWSMGIFIRELSVLFEAFSLGNPSPLAELPLQYADFAHWQRRWLSGEVLEAEAAYWRERLVDAPVLELPTDRPRPPSSTSRGAHLSLALPAGLSERLEKLVLEQDVTLFMILLAGFGALLSRITGQHDLCVGTPIANRTHKQLEGLIGFFVNTLVLRIDTSDRATSDREGPRFTELLQRLREVALQAYAHQNLPFERLVEELDLARDPSRTPLYQVMFALQNTPTETFELPDLTLEPVAVEIATAAFDLTLSFTRTPNGLHYDAEYNTDLFDDTTIRRLGHHLARVLAGIADDPGTRLRELTLQSEAEHHQLRLEWNDHAASVLRKAWIPQLFEAQVAQIPETVAVSSAQRNLSYRELNHRANQLAYQLESRGIGPETRVGVCMERSPEMVISFLAILKAGATYTPLDPTYPRARLAFLLEDAGVALVLTQERLLDRLPHPPPPVLCPSTDREAAGRRESPIPRSMDSDRTTAPEPLPDSVCVQLRPVKKNRFCGDTAAYLLYTSGSTGEPKGVVISHHGIRNYLLWTQKVLPLTPADRVLQTTPFTFDVSVWEMWAPLVAGARLVLARPGGHRDASYLTAEIRRRR
ncbi:MAG: AMP-binding protein, partial [bacterium]|nr:AMP-binding protein [bacterium]